MSKEYEMLHHENDPIDMACDDCKVHQIPVWESVTTEELEELRQEWKSTGDTRAHDTSELIAEGLEEGWLREAL